MKWEWLVIGLLVLILLSSTIGDRINIANRNEQYEAIQHEIDSIRAVQVSLYIKVDSLTVVIDSIRAKKNSIRAKYEPQISAIDTLHVDSIGSVIRSNLFF